ncbi:protein LTO1 homolog isoform X3 [Varanus komodoensis]|uniref:protein LTO1 homolog isoform X3 n=1 Tax=Varanus komodoensis TaxID=61221 RepID=UPI001CF7D04E|nr:protein LTO1 homolog isoform X3 [Varanus komodoensis]
MEAGACEQDAFEAIVMADSRFHGEGYQEGYSEGLQAGVIEGRQYGLQQGASIGLEIGSYLGFAVTWQRLLHKGSDGKHRKKIKVLESLIEMIQKFPREDPVYDKLQEDLVNIRGRFKQPKNGETILNIPTYRQTYMMKCRAFDHMDRLYNMHNFWTFVQSVIRQKEKHVLQIRSITSNCWQPFPTMVSRKASSKWASESMKGHRDNEVQRRWSQATLQNWFLMQAFKTTPA